MKRMSFRLVIALLTFVLGMASTWLAGFYPKSTSSLVEPMNAGNLVDPIASVRVQKKPRFRFVEQFCESGCEEIYETSDGEQVSSVIACYSISPKYAVVAAIVGTCIVLVRRPMISGVTSLALMSGLAALIVRRQLRYRLVANPSWPAAFDDLHRLGLLVVVLLLASTLVDDCQDQQGEQVS